MEQTVDALDKMISVNNLINEMKREDFDTDELKTKDAIAVCKMKLFGEYLLKKCW
ncbi:hypothetical protein [Bacillus sp. Marseille-P3661]|uniref:hypothetical protein n=1 Tax=Bacillus sp. Marseille-P3661 TaxID=1936234 RepID=UPI0015E17434|nr:hypothetical protein [Bacillus sp. Marseille-P3661]